VSAAQILVIEDNPADVELLRQALIIHGDNFRLEVCSDGQQALEFIGNQRRMPKELHPCVIVLDLDLPRHNGFEVLQALREEPVLTHIGVMVLTGHISPRQENELKRLGAYYRTKPDQLSNLVDLAAELIAICNKLIETNTRVITQA
jgi:two-component system, chemotaxis family, response regulator Rcp1